MNSKELVKQTMMGKDCGKTPIYAWVKANLSKEISDEFGSVENFEDHYKFDLAHLFGGPQCYGKEFEKLKESGEEITPEMLLSIQMNDPNMEEDYKGIIQDLKHHNARERFCYVQTDGIFEALNGCFGIQNHMLYLALYPEQLKEVYQRKAEWNIKVAKNLIELGVDGIHVSDDWGAQNSLMFSHDMFRELIFPYHKQIVDAVKSSGDVLVSLHSDGCIAPVLDDVAELKYDFIHPWQENANMPYSLYLEKYQDKFGILGGVCVQSTLGFNNYSYLESEIKRVFNTLKGKRWACCTSHFVQDHCSMEELIFAYDLIRKLADS